MLKDSPVEMQCASRQGGSPAWKAEERVGIHVHDVLGIWMVFKIIMGKMRPPKEREAQTGH